MAPPTTGPRSSDSIHNQNIGRKLRILFCWDELGGNNRCEGPASPAANSLKGLKDNPIELDKSYLGSDTGHHDDSQLHHRLSRTARGREQDKKATATRNTSLRPNTSLNLAQTTMTPKHEIDKAKRTMPLQKLTDIAEKPSFSKPPNFLLIVTSAVITTGTSRLTRDIIVATLQDVFSRADATTYEPKPGVVDMSDLGLAQLSLGRAQGVDRSLGNMMGEDGKYHCREEEGAGKSERSNWRPT
ncbi:hypothetical protein EV127DRAFT_403218 [Xylaria flabelliformis]|nr:hypothetical protein EV127DRAFT_403218 [Xylaria flabelliformis]